MSTKWIIDEKVYFLTSVLKDEKGKTRLFCSVCCHFSHNWRCTVVNLTQISIRCVWWWMKYWHHFTYTVILTDRTNTFDQMLYYTVRFNMCHYFGKDCMLCEQLFIRSKTVKNKLLIHSVWWLKIIVKLECRIDVQEKTNI